MKILCLDLTTPQALIVLKNEQDYQYLQLIELRRQAEYLLPSIDQLLKQAGIALNDLDYYACNIGPGSFTSSRLAVSCIQAFAVAACKPVIKLSSLQIMAQAAYLQTDQAAVIAILNAHMGQCYCANYNYDSATGLMQLQGAEQLFDNDELTTRINLSNYRAAGFELDNLFGTGFNYYQISLAEHLTALNELISQPALQRNAIDYHALEPSYLRGSEAWKKA